MGSNKIEPDKRIIKAAVAAVLLALIFVAYFFDPVFYKVTDCSFKHLTGVSCPGCGLTRSFHAFANFHINEAFGFHLIGPFILIGFLILFLKLAIEAITGRGIKAKLKPGITKVLIIIFVIVWVGFWIVRMIGEIL